MKEDKIIEDGKYYNNNNIGYAIDRKKETQMITNDLLTEATRVRDINGIQDSLIRLKWQKHGLMEYKHANMKTKLLEEGICLNKTSGNNFFDYINSKWLEDTYENLSKGYVKKDNIPSFDIDINKLKEAIKWFNSFLAFLPNVQRNYTKALILPNFHYILKQECTQKRNVIKSIVINGVTGASKTSIAMLIYYMFNIDAEYTGLETTPFEFNTQASIRNVLSKNASIVLFDEMDEEMVNIKTNKYLTQEFKDLLKNTFKMNLKGTANLDLQGDNKEYAYLGAPIMTLNTDVVIEEATRKRIYYFKCLQSCNLMDFLGRHITIDDINLIRELGKTIWKIVKETNFEEYIIEKYGKNTSITDKAILKVIVDKVNEICGYKEDDKDSLMILHDIDDSESLNTMKDTVFYSLHMRIRDESHLTDIFTWIKENRNGKILVHPTMFYQYVQAVMHDNTISREKVLTEFNLHNRPKVKKHFIKNSQNVCVFESENEFLEYIGFFMYRNPIDTEMIEDIDWNKQEIHMLKNLKAEVEDMKIKPYTQK